jgi:hypothetical protein
VARGIEGKVALDVWTKLLMIKQAKSGWGRVFMDTKPARNYTALAIAIVVAALIIGSVACLTISSTSTITISASSTANLPQGLRLAAGLNATAIGAGQSLSLAISLFNTASQINSISSANDWPFAGLPVFVSSPCDYYPPLEFVVLKGHYTEGNLSAGAKGLVPYVCTEDVSVDHLVFEARSYNFSMTGIFQGQASYNQTDGPYQAAINLTVSGYWDPFTTSQMQNSSFPTLFQEYFSNYSSYRATSPPPQHTFTAGVYTVAVADEWGDLAIDYFTVN